MVWHWALMADYIKLTSSLILIRSRVRSGDFSDASPVCSCCFCFFVHLCWSCLGSCPRRCFSFFSSTLILLRADRRISSAILRLPTLAAKCRHVERTCRGSDSIWLSNKVQYFQAGVNHFMHLDNRLFQHSLINVSQPKKGNIYFHALHMQRGAKLKLSGCCWGWALHHDYGNSNKVSGAFQDQV